MRVQIAYNSGFNVERAAQVHSVGQSEWCVARQSEEQNICQQPCVQEQMKAESAPADKSLPGSVARRANLEAARKITWPAPDTKTDPAATW